MTSRSTPMRSASQSPELPLLRGNAAERQDGLAEGETVFRVSELNRAVRTVLEEEWGEVWVVGELSDVTRAASGHAYFTLNDESETAQIRCVMFRGDVQRSAAKFRDGETVRLRGKLSLYEPRGSFQLIARVALPEGVGALHLEFERIRKKLEAEGLFASERKRALPHFPKVVGVVTSTQGAALFDILRVTKNRCPVRVVIAPCLVQGVDAPASILKALLSIQRVPDIDVVIIGRGGGAAEDLFAFNDENLARAIAQCRVPVISAVGHEVDITIADLVADMRASTPSNAAEIAVPKIDVLVSELEHADRAMQRGMEVLIGRLRLKHSRLYARLLDPRRALSGVRFRLFDLRARLERSIRRDLSVQRATVNQLHSRLIARDARQNLVKQRAMTAALHARLAVQAGRLLEKRKSVLAEKTARLLGLSPLAILERGYAIALDTSTGMALRRAGDSKKGAAVRVVLHEGALETRVEKIVSSS